MSFRPRPRTVLVAASIVAPMAAGAVTLTNGVVDISIVRPTTGVQYVFVTGTLTATATGEQISAFVDQPYTTSGATLELGDVYNLQINAALASTGTYSGPLFSFYATPTTPTGRYDRTVNLVTQAGFRFNSNLPAPLPGPSGAPDGAPNVTAAYSVTVVPVPEPATMALLGLGALGVLRRRKGSV